MIGVVADVRDDGIDRRARQFVYWPLLQKNFEIVRVNVVATPPL